MTWVMLIAPGADVDRTWLALGPVPSAVQYFTDWPPAAGLGLPEGSEIVTAPIRRMRAPGWRIILQFALAGDRVPHGYVMPGWVQGEPFESVPVCTWCYGHTAPDGPPRPRLPWDGNEPFVRHTEQECLAERERRRPLRMFR
jgi:hypothetical protein